MSTYRNSATAMLAGLAFLSANSFADIKDTTFYAGAKLLLNSWTEDYSTSDGQPYTDKFDLGAAGILSATAKNGQLFVTGSTMLNSHYAKKKEAVGSKTYSGDLTRQDVDIAVGWTFLPQASALIGYKSISGTKDAFFTDDKGVKTKYFANDWTVNTFFIGFSGSQQISGPFFGYYNAIIGLDGTATNDAASLVEGKVKNTKNKTSSNYYNAEIGVGYSLNQAVQLALGYRKQQVTFEKGNTFKNSGDLNALSFGVNYSF